MKTKDWIVISIGLLAILGAGCVSKNDPPTVITTDPTTDACRISLEDTKTLTPSPSKGSLVMARAALISFFDALNGGWYDEAALQYGSSYEALIELNPDIDPSDHAALLERACTINGFQCLRIKEVVQQTQPWPDTYTFSVEFSNIDGSLFELSACCGEEAADTPSQSVFEITVMQVPMAGNEYLVQGLPVYTP